MREGLCGSQWECNGLVGLILSYYVYGNLYFVSSKENSICGDCGRFDILRSPGEIKMSNEKRESFMASRLQMAENHVRRHVASM